jgi:hypothetical protein
MGKFVDGIKSLFSAPDTSAQDEQIKQARESERLALDKQRETAQGAEGEADLAAGAARRIPRGRRLLLAATGEGGVSGKLGG